MGIKDLLKFMKPYIEPIHIKKYSGKRVGIDAYSWLHKGAYSCSMEICLNTKGDKKLQYLNYFMHRINLLKHYKVTPVVVFDGGNLPCKAATEDERHRRRNANRELAMEKLKEGDIKTASELFQRGVSITPSMAHQLIQILRSENIEYVVAPYEADAQLAYLSTLEPEKGGIEAVITEDSDLVAYGCQAIIFKMDRYGNGEEMLFEKVFNSTSCIPSFRSFSNELFTGMCVLAGCDFLPSVPGIGIKKAYSLICKYQNLDRALSVLKLEKGNQVPEDYPKCFREAVAVFQHARIYDIAAKKLRHLKPLPEKVLQSLTGELDFLGPEIPPSIATAIAAGNIDPVTMEAFNYSMATRCEPPNAASLPDQLCKNETIAISTRGKCFTTFSSKQAREVEHTVRQNSTLDESKYLKNDAYLEKLILPPKRSLAAESAVDRESIHLKVPNNNPFRIRNTDQIHSDHEKIVMEEASVLTEAKLEVSISNTPGYTTPSCRTYQNMKRKHGQVRLDLDETRIIESSEVSDIENPKIFSTPLNSQESVNSKPKSVGKENRQDKVKKKLKQSSSKSSETKCTILNFFPRM